MRMRKKKNLEERLEAVSDYLIECWYENLNFKESVKTKHYFDFKELFGNTNPVVLEIGGGKGQFSCTFAKENPEYNVLCIEKVGNVIVSACELAKKMELHNIKFVKCDAEYLESYIEPKSICRLYLNFSCPYPKKSYAKHRLTHHDFLEIYKVLLQDGALICQKTDNMHFFEFSLEQFSSSGFSLQNVSLDLHNSDYEGNIVTEYEKRFADLGQPIYRLEAFVKE